MCNEQELVPIPDHVRVPDDKYFSGESPEFGIDTEGRKCFKMDKCIIPLVKKLWAAGFKTTGSCCGHGSYQVISVDVDGDEWALINASHPHCGIGWVEDQSKFHEWRMSQ
jgi:hypothetical protein